MSRDLSASHLSTRYPSIWSGVPAIQLLHRTARASRLQKLPTLGSQVSKLYRISLYSTVQRTGPFTVCWRYSCTFPSLYWLDGGAPFSCPRAWSESRLPSSSLPWTGACLRCQRYAVATSSRYHSSKNSWRKACWRLWKCCFRENKWALSWPALARYKDLPSTQLTCLLSSFWKSVPTWTFLNGTDHGRSWNPGLR